MHLRDISQHIYKTHLTQAKGPLPSSFFTSLLPMVANKLPHPLISEGKEKIPLHVLAFNAEIMTRQIWSNQPPD